MVGFRVPFHSESELMVSISPGPLGLRPQDPPAVSVRPAPRGLLHEGDGVANQTRHQIVLQKQQMYVHSHVGARRRARSRSLNNFFLNPTGKRRNREGETSGRFPSNFDQSTAASERQVVVEVSRRIRAHPEVKSARPGRAA